MDGSFLGLGYVNSEKSNHENPQQRPTLTPSANDRVVDDYVNEYFQQCLQYHEEQELVRKKQRQAQPCEESIEFISGGVVVVVVQRETSVVDNASSKLAKAPTAVDGVSSLEEQEAIARGRQRFREILFRFQQQQEQLLYLGKTADEPSLFLEQRRRGLQRELGIQKQFWLKNLEYVAQKEEQRLQRLEGQLAAARALEEHVKAAQYHALSTRRRQQQQQPHAPAQPSDVILSQAGIGTKKQQQAERIKQQTGLAPVPKATNTVAVYISGLPTDGSVTDQYIRTLFGSFGTIEKVHFYYLAKKQFKGDGLVIYSLADHCRMRNVGTDLVQRVCQQMNGAELPNGNRLIVEPSFSNKPAVRQTEPKDCDATNEQSPSAEETKLTENGEHDKELDDFFSGL